MKMEDLKKIDYDKIMQKYRQAFQNPGSFIFTFVGNIDEETLKPVILQYLASIEGKQAKNNFTKVPLDILSGKRKVIVERQMQTPKATIFNAFSGKMKRDLKNILILSILNQTLDILYTEKVREKEGGTYGVEVGGEIARYPEGQTFLEIGFDTDPEKAMHLNGIIHTQLEEFAKNGPREADFKKVIEHMEKANAETVKENGYWLGVLNTKYVYGEDTHSGYLKTLKSIARADVQRFAKELLSQGKEKVVIMMPKK